MIHWPDEEAGTPADAMESWYDVVPTSTLDYSTLAPVYGSIMSSVYSVLLTTFFTQLAEDDEGRLLFVENEVYATA